MKFVLKAIPGFYSISPNKIKVSFDFGEEFSSIEGKDDNW